MKKIMKEIKIIAHHDHGKTTVTNGVLGGVRVCVCGYCGRLLGEDNMPNPTIQGLEVEIPSDAERVEGSCCILKERGII